MTTHEVTLTEPELDENQFSSVFVLSAQDADPKISHAAVFMSQEGTQWERYTSHPNPNQGSSQLGEPFLAQYGDVINTALLGKDGLGYSVAGYYHMKEHDRIRDNSVRLKGQDKPNAAQVSENEAREMDADYPNVVADDVSWLNQLVEASNLHLFVGLSPFNAKHATRMALIVGFDTVHDSTTGMVRPRPIVSDQKGTLGYLPFGFQLDGLYVLAKKS
jgi:hypothetical protein